MKVPITGPPNAKILLVGEAPGAEEDRQGKPFIGQAGRTLDLLLSNAGISRHDCLITNVAKERPPGNKIAFYYEDKKCTRPKPIMQEWIKELKKEIEFYNPNIVIPLGAIALQTICGISGIQAYRGYIMESTLVPRQKVLPTYHPQAVGYDWKLHFPTIMDLRKAVKESEISKLPKDNRKLNCTSTKLEYIGYLKWLLKEHKGPIAVDIETTQPGSHIDIMGIADSPTHAVAFEFIHSRKPKYSLEDELEIWKLLGKVLSTKDLIMHNGSYDAAVIWYNNGIFCKNFKYDTMIAGHAAWPECPRSLAFMSSICLNVPPWKHQSQSLPLLYNAADAANTFGIWEVMETEMEKLKVRNTFDFEMSQVFPAMMLQLQGLYVDLNKRKIIKKEIEERLEELKEELTQDLGKEVILKADKKKKNTLNINSSKQLAELLYIDMGLPVQYKRRKSVQDTRTTTADAEALNKLTRQTKNPVLLKILEVKKLSKLSNSFINMEVSPQSRVHTCYNVTGATMSRTGTGKQKGLIIDDEENYKSFGRWSSSKSIILPYGSGNLQNIPYAARKLYTAPKGYCFLQADYKQAEAVVVAFNIGDQKLINMFSNAFGKSNEYCKEQGWDIHKLTGASMFGVDIKDVTPEQRKVGKLLRHATNYAAGPGVIAPKLGIAITQAKKLLKQFMGATPELPLYHSRIRNELRKSGVLTNLLGRKHRFLERWGDTLFRSAYSFIPQSTVGDLMNLSLTKFYNKYGSLYNIVLQLHDAIYLIIKEEEKFEAMHALKESMIRPLKTETGQEFLIDIDFSFGPDWGSLEDFDYYKHFGG